MSNIEPIVLKASRRKWMIVLLGCAAFTVIGAFMVRAGESTGWLPLIFFGLGMLVSIVLLLPGASGLKLDAEGFEIIKWFKPQRTRWQDASEFAAVAIPPSLIKVVCYNDAKVRPGGLADLNRAIAGCNAAVPDTYGYSAEALADLMNEWRTRATKD